MMTKRKQEKKRGKHRLSKEDFAKLLQKFKVKPLKDAAELAYGLERIPKADLVDLSLFFRWGMTVLRNKWIDRSGY